MSAIPFGGEHLAAALGSALRSSRWVSLVGPPGSGKSLHAELCAAEHPPATWVPLAGLTEVDAVLDAVVSALAVLRAPGDDPEAAISRALDESERLLILDGIGPHLTGLGPVLQRILEATRRSRLLCTTGAITGLAGELVIRVDPLPLPAGDQPLAGPAVDLLQSRIRAAGAAPLDLQRDEAEVRRLLQATGGLPLLVQQVAVQIALVGLTNVVVPRSLTQAISTSYGLLDPAQRRVFRRLSLLPVAVGLDVVASIADLDRDATGEIVVGLSRRSLLRVGDDGRFDLLAPLREFAAAQADEHDRDRVRTGLVDWADRVLPSDYAAGTADEPWLTDLPVLRHAILTAGAAPDTLHRAYDLANRTFGTLYTGMRFGDAAELLGSVVRAGDGPPAIGAQVSRRAGIAASEAAGTYDGLALLTRAEEQAAATAEPDVERARTASIRAEMHLDAGDFDQARAEAERALSLAGEDGHSRRQATRTLADAWISMGELDLGSDLATALAAEPAPDDQAWLSLAAEALSARIALERGRVAEAIAAARVLAERSRAAGEDRVALIAALLGRQADPTAPPPDADADALPWSLRIPVLVDQARALLQAGEPERAAGRAADVVVLAGAARLGSHVIEAELLLTECLRATGDDSQAATTLVSALERAARAPLPLRAADALDGLASLALAHDDQVAARRFAATAYALRRRSRAKPWMLCGAGGQRVTPAGMPAPESWLEDGRPTARLLDDIDDWHSEFAVAGAAGATTGDDVLAPLTAAERQVAWLVAEGLTSREIAERLYVSPRTVDAHLANSYRKLGIRNRSRLAALMTRTARTATDGPATPIGPAA